MIAPQLFHGAPDRAQAWRAVWRRHWSATQVMVLLAATETAAVPGISAAGATPQARLGTAAADAELLLLGPDAPRPHALPPLPAGVSPALLSHVVVRELGLCPLVVDLGCAIAPAVPHVRLPSAFGIGPARCVSSGQALPRWRVEALVGLGRRWGRRLARRSPPTPLLIAECVPGGTTTALAVLCGLGVEAAGLVSGSLRHPAHALKQNLVEAGFRSAGAVLAKGRDNDPLAVLSALGDPMQALAAGLLLGAALEEGPVLLAGGSQMVAVWALALALAPSSLRRRMALGTALATTRWVADESGSDLERLLQLLSHRWQVDLLAFRAALNFLEPCHPALAAFEQGYVKEGVGAGGMAVLWELSGRDHQALARRCDEACGRLQPLPPPMAHGGLRSLDG